MVKENGNDPCADCNLKGARWASHNIGCFLCIRCGGLHRKMGTHISKVKSITLDAWDDDMIKVNPSNPLTTINQDKKLNLTKNVHFTLTGFLFYLTQIFVCLEYASLG